MILKEIMWCDNKMAGLIGRIRLSARGLKLGILHPAPAGGTEPEGAGVLSGKDKNEKKKKV